MNKNEEHILIDDLKSGNPRAFDRLVDYCGRDIYRLALRLTGIHDAAEDLVQDVFLSIVKSIDGFNGRAGLKTWMYRITVNAYLSSRRSKMVSHTQADDRIDLIHPDTDNAARPDSETDRSLLVDKINLLLNELSAGQRSVFVLRHFHEFSLNEIAETTGMKPGTVKTHLYRAVEKMQRGLTEEYKNINS